MASMDSKAQFSALALCGWSDDVGTQHEIWRSGLEHYHFSYAAGDTLELGPDGVRYNMDRMEIQSAVL